MRADYYERIVLTRPQLLLTYLIGAGLAFVAVWIFFQSIIAATVAIGFTGFAPNMARPWLLERRRKSARAQFKEMLYALRTSLAAGRSLENSFIAAEQDLAILYPNENEPIRQELRIVQARLANREPIETILASYAARTQLEPIEQFVDVIVVCKRSGGNLIAIVQQTTQSISEQIELEQQLEVLLAQKKGEARLLLVIPFIILLLLNGTAPDYMDSIYSGYGYLLLAIAFLSLGLIGYWIHRMVAMKW